jgi:hypothetical protein
MHPRNDQEQTDSQPRRTATWETRRPTTAVGERMTRRFEVEPEERAESPRGLTMMQDANREEGIDEQMIPPPDYASGAAANNCSQPTNNPSSTIPASHVYHLRLNSGLGKDCPETSVCAQAASLTAEGTSRACFPPLTIRNHRRIQETERNWNHSKSALTKSETFTLQSSLQIDKPRYLPSSPPHRRRRSIHLRWWKWVGYVTP